VSATAPSVALVDYGSGNLRSVAKALERSGLLPEVTSDPLALARADAVVLPGAGAFRDAAERLAAKGLDDAVRRCIDDGKPYLGLCLGLQLLFDEGHEHGVTPGLGVLRGRVERFPATAPSGQRLLVPHIGWNEVRYQGVHPILDRLPPRDVYYFVHSYRVLPEDPACVVGVTDHGDTFVSAVATERIFAVQFHPEKSQAAGRRLLDAFGVWVASCR
jgi:glutamine amidotransferase